MVCHPTDGIHNNHKEQDNYKKNAQTALALAILRGAGHGIHADSSPEARIADSVLQRSLREKLFLFIKFYLVPTLKTY